MEKSAATEANAKLAAASREIADLNEPSVQCSRSLGELRLLHKKKKAELALISPTMDPDNLWVDPADADPAMRLRRVELRAEIGELNKEVTRQEDIHRDLNLKLTTARRDLHIAEAEAKREAIRQKAAAVVRAMHEARNAVWDLFAATEQAARDFESHEFFPEIGKRIPAHLGSPPMPRRLIDGLMELSRLLLASLAEWDQTIFDPESPERIRAEHITKIEQQASEAGLAAHKRMAAAARKDPSKPPPRPPDIFDVMAENEQSVAARFGTVK